MRERLEKLSAREQLSLNHVMNEGLRQYGEWGAVYRQAGLAVVGKRLLHDLFDNLSEQRAREFGRRNGLEEAPSMIISWFGAFDLKNALRLFGSILARYSGEFLFEHSQEGQVHTVVVRHDMGSHASAYYAEYAKAVCELLKMPCSVSETEAQVIIKAEEAIITPGATMRGLPKGLVQETSGP